MSEKGREEGKRSRDFLPNSPPVIDMPPPPSQGMSLGQRIELERRERMEQHTERLDELKAGVRDGSIGAYEFNREFNKVWNNVVGQGRAREPRGRSPTSQEAERDRAERPR